MRERLTPYMDCWEMIGNLLPDGDLEMGDASQRTGTALFYERVTEDKIFNWLSYEEQARALLNPPRRHLDPGKWPGQEGTLSRDNATPMILGNPDYARTIFWKLLKRGGFFWNVKDLEGKRKKWPIPDWAGPATLGAIIRGTNFWPAYPLLTFTDIFLLLSTIWTVVRYGAEPEHTSDLLNKDLLTIQGVWAFPTPLSLLARIIFRKDETLKGIIHYYRKRKEMIPPPIDKIHRELRRIL